MLIGGDAAYFGLMFLGLTISIGLPFLLSTDLPGSLRLMNDPRTAAGRVERVSLMDAAHNDQKIIKHEYAFKIPGGRRVQGVSFEDVPSGGEPRDAEYPPAQGPEVIVEYAPGDPTINRIRGMRTALFSPWAVPLSMLLPALGGAIALGGILGNLRTIRLLEWGLPTRAHILSCLVGQGDDEHERSFAETRRALLAKPPRPLDDESKPSRSRPSVDGCLMLPVHAFFVLGWAALLFMLVFEAVANRPMMFNGRPIDRAAGLAFSVFFLIAWSGVWVYFSRSTRQMLRVMRGVDPPSSLGFSTALECMFEYPTIEAGLVRSRERVAALDRLGGGEDEPALYDPDRPTRATLPAGLRPSVRPSEDGGWEADGPGAVRRTALLALCCVVAPLAGAAFWAFNMR